MPLRLSPFGYTTRWRGVFQGGGSFRKGGMGSFLTEDFRTISAIADNTRSASPAYKHIHWTCTVGHVQLYMYAVHVQLYLYSAHVQLYMYAVHVQLYLYSAHVQFYM